MLCDREFCRIQRIFCILVLLSLPACSGGISSGSSTQAVSLQISGTVQYEDKMYDAYGFSGATAYKPVRHAVVELVNEDDSIADSATTDEAGHYQLSGVGRNPRVRVLAQTNDVIGSMIAIRNFSGNIYAVTHLVGGSDEVIVDLNIPQSSNAAGAFNMLDVFTYATQFVSGLTTRSMPELNAYWVNKNNNYGTYFCSRSLGTSSCPQGKGIYVLGGNSTGGDSDHYDDDVLYHEYAHYIESMLGATDSPGGTHYLTENDQDLRLTWSEGLGGFFPAAVKTWLMRQNPQLLSSDPLLPPSYFVDTYGSYVGISMDFNHPNASFCAYGIDCFIYSSNEVAVAKILYNLMDSYGMQAVWDIYANYMSVDTVHDATLETFWDGWMSQRAPGSRERSTVSGIFAEREVDYLPDSYESDNDLTASRRMIVCSGTGCDGETHDLYDGLSSDKDLVSFYALKGTSYLVETLNLKNGADTYIRILDRYGYVAYSRNGNVMVNDNRPGTLYCGSYDTVCRIHNDDLMLSSELTFMPYYSGTYYVEVSSSANRPKAAGRYGTYTLQISD